MNAIKVGSYIKLKRKELGIAQIELINESIRDMRENKEVHDGPMFFNEMKTKYGK